MTEQIPKDTPPPVETLTVEEINAIERSYALTGIVSNDNTMARLLASARAQAAHSKAVQTPLGQGEREKAFLEIWTMFARLNSPQWAGACSVIYCYARDQGLKLDYPKAPTSTERREGDVGGGEREDMQRACWSTRDDRHWCRTHKSTWTDGMVCDAKIKYRNAHPNAPLAVHIPHPPSPLEPQEDGECNCKLEGYTMPWDGPCPIHSPNSPRNPLSPHTG